MPSKLYVPLSDLVYSVLSGPERRLLIYFVSVPEYFLFHPLCMFLYTCDLFYLAVLRSFSKALLRS